MTAADQQLAQLGQQVLDQLIEAYNPDHAPGLALAILPGQVVDNDVVQNGVQNPLVVSEWLHTAFDDAIELTLADATPVPTSLGAPVTLSASYREAVSFAAATGAAGSPESDRVNSMIALARGDLGPNPEFLPLGCDPDDWAEPVNDGYWRVFDTTIQTTHTETTTTEEAAPGPAVNKEIWQLQGLQARAVVDPEVKSQWIAADLATSDQFRVRIQRAIDPAVQPATLVAVSPASVAVMDTAPAEMYLTAMPIATTRATATLSGGKIAQLGLLADSISAPTAEEPHIAVNATFSKLALDHMTLVNASSSAEPAIMNRNRLGWLLGADAPKKEVTTTTTTTSDLHVHFEHCLITITRSFSGKPWWHPELIADDGWYVPGIDKGEFVPGPTDTTAHCLPRALLLVRKVEITGEWTDDAKAAFSQPASMFGPFVLEPASATAAASASVQKTTVLGDGIQVVGLFGTPLPAIPPQAPPS